MSVMSLINAHYNGGESKKAGKEWENHTNRGHQTSEANVLELFFCVCRQPSQQQPAGAKKKKTKKNRQRAAATDKMRIRI